MPLPIEDFNRQFRTVEIPISYLREDGESAVYTLRPKYRPLTQRQVDELDALTKKLDGEIEHQEESVINQAFDDVQEFVQALLNGDQQVSQSPAHKAVFLGALSKLISQRIQLSEEQKEERKQLIAVQLERILLDLDMTEGGQPIAPTVEFLMTLDLELLQDITAEIRKKTFRQRTT